MAGSGSNQRQKNKVINVRVTPEFKDAITRASGNNSEADWVRNTIGRELVKFGEPVHLPKNRPAKRKIPDGASVELAEAARAVSRQTGILKLLAQSCREGGYPDLHQETERALAETSALANRLIELLDKLEGKST